MMELCNGGRVVYVKKPAQGPSEAYYALHFLGTDWWKHEVKDLQEVRIVFSDSRAKATLYFEGKAESFQTSIGFYDDVPWITQANRSELQSRVDRTNQLINGPQRGIAHFFKTVKWPGYMMGGLGFVLFVGILPFKIKGKLDVVENRMIIRYHSVFGAVQTEHEYALNLIKEFQIKKVGLQSYGIYVDHFSDGLRPLFRPGFFKRRKKLTNDLNQFLVVHRYIKNKSDES